MDSTDRRIEIFAPFGEAFELTRKILFQPFDIAKWFVIGFPAWLATFFSGGGFNFRGFGKQNWDWRSQYHGPAFSTHEMPPWLLPLLVGGGILLLAFIVFLLWVNARGRFMFTDCIVHNRGAVAQPWREYRIEGNRYFVLQIVVSLASMIVFGGLGLLFFFGEKWNKPILPLALIILIGAVFVLAAIVIGVIMHFMVPVMYRQRCDAFSAFRQVWELILGHPGVFVLFVLFYVLLYIAGAMIGCLLACATCCIAALPYIGTVILLPVITLLYAFPLCFLRQFGDQYDVWADVAPVETGQPPAPLPPVQEPPPPPPVT